MASKAIISLVILLTISAWLSWHSYNVENLGFGTFSNLRGRNFSQHEPSSWAKMFWPWPGSLRSGAMLDRFPFFLAQGLRCASACRSDGRRFTCHVLHCRWPSACLAITWLACHVFPEGEVPKFCRLGVRSFTLHGSPPLNLHTIVKRLNFHATRFGCVVFCSRRRTHPREIQHSAGRTRRVQIEHGLVG